MYTCSIIYLYVKHYVDQLKVDGLRARFFVNYRLITEQQGSNTARAGAVPCGSALSARTGQGAPVGTLGRPPNETHTQVRTLDNSQTKILLHL